MNPRRSIFDRAHRFPTWETMGWDDPDASATPCVLDLTADDRAFLASLNISPL